MPLIVIGLDFFLGIIPQSPFLEAVWMEMLALVTLFCKRISSANPE